MTCCLQLSGAVLLLANGSQSLVVIVRSNGLNKHIVLGPSLLQSTTEPRNYPLLHKGDSL
jgi:hypothetical protein